MRVLKNRTVIGVICIVLSLIICFVVTPLFQKTMSEKKEIVRVVKPIRSGEEITADMVKTVEVAVIPAGGCSKTAGYGDWSLCIGRPGTRGLHSCLQDCRGTGGGKCLSVSPDWRKAGDFRNGQGVANGLSGKLKSGDIVSVIAPDYKKQGMTVIPAELQYVEVIAVTANSGYDANTGEELEEGRTGNFREQ